MIAVGVGTHKHRHVAAALNQLGQVLGEISVAASAAGYRELVSWLAGLGGEAMVGIEGAGSYGAGLCRHLQAAGISVVEVERPAGGIGDKASLTASTRFWRRNACWLQTASAGCSTSCRACT
jgi:Transposase